MTVSHVHGKRGFMKYNLIGEIIEFIKSFSDLLIVVRTKRSPTHLEITILLSDGHPSSCQQAAASVAHCYRFLNPEEELSMN